MIDYFDGLMLGDGHIGARNTKTARYRFAQRIDHKDWIYLQKDYFDKLNINYTIFNIAPKQELYKNRLISRQEQIIIQTHSYPYLYKQRLRWYPNGIKVIPRDLNINSPELLANWYMGDGTISTVKRLQITISTDSFLKEDIEWIKSELTQHHSIHSLIFLTAAKQPRLTIQHKNASKFLELIAPHIIDSYKYKLPENPWKAPKCLTCKKEMFDRIAGTKYCYDCWPARKLELQNFHNNKRKIRRLNYHGTNGYSRN